MAVDFRDAVESPVVRFPPRAPSRSDSGSPAGAESQANAPDPSSCVQAGSMQSMGSAQSVEYYASTDPEQQEAPGCDTGQSYSWPPSDPRQRTTTAVNAIVTHMTTNNMRRQLSSIQLSSATGLVSRTSSGQKLIEFLHREYDRENWTGSRHFCVNILEASWGETNMFDTLMGLVIIFNTGLMVIESDSGAWCPEGEECAPNWVKVCDSVLLIVYTIELLFRLFAFRSLFFFTKGWVWNCLDLFIVVFGYIGMGMQDSRSFKKLQMFRICRVARVVRVARLLRRFPTLFNMISGFYGAMQAMLWGLIMILILLVMWSIMAVELIHPVNKTLGYAEDDWCLFAFSSVLHSVLLFFQTLVAGDSWGQCAIPILRKDPFLFVLFALALVCIQLGFTNLILATIVDKAAEARELGVKEKREALRNAEEESIIMWRQILSHLDINGDGQVSEEEVLGGFQDRKVRHKLTEAFRLCESDVAEVFRLKNWAQRGTGVVYDEFIDAFREAHTQDPRIAMMTVKLRLEHLEHKLDYYCGALAKDINQSVNSLRGSMRSTDLSCEPPQGLHGLPPREPPQGLHGLPPQRMPLEKQSVDKSRQDPLRPRQGSGVILPTGGDADISDVADVRTAKQIHKEVSFMAPLPEQSTEVGMDEELCGLNVRSINLRGRAEVLPAACNSTCDSALPDISGPEAIAPDTFLHELRALGCHLERRLEALTLQGAEAAASLARQEARLELLGAAAAELNPGAAAERNGGRLGVRNSLRARAVSETPGSKEQWQILRKEESLSPVAQHASPSPLALAATIQAADKSERLAAEASAGAKNFGYRVDGVHADIVVNRFEGNPDRRRAERAGALGTAVRPHIA